jgi:hypothetical protein
MAHRLRAVLMAFLIVAFAPSLVPIGTRSAYAATEPPSGPDRFKVITQEYTSYEWWLTNWKSNKVACSIITDHEGLPLGGEIYSSCGKTIYDQWIGTKSCGSDGSCSGYYLQLIHSTPSTRKIGIPLPAPVVWVTLEGCSPVNSTFRCQTLPSLLLRGEEPLDGEKITSLGGTVNGRPFACDSICHIDLVPTSDPGITITFWAFSSYGDSSVAFDARVRVIPVDDVSGHYFYADVLSTQWNDVPLAAGSLTWDAFPPLGGVPEWLSTPNRPTDLATSISFEYLAAQLIKQGAVDVSSCADVGLTQDGTASACGVAVARPAVNNWQNRFDDLIYSASISTSVPAQLLKNIFARESQFWPGVNKGLPEAGLGQLTEGGADTALLWNRLFFEQFCPTMLDEAVCTKGYSHLQIDQQLFLDRALVKSVDAFCQDCPLSIDINRAEKSVDIFAETLHANSEQVGMIIYNIYTVSPGTAVSYEDLWRFTLVNYNAGPGCLTLALLDTRDSGEPPDWQHLSTHFTPVCQPAYDYVNDINGLTP